MWRIKWFPWQRQESGEERAGEEGEGGPNGKDRGGGNSRPEGQGNGDDREMEDGMGVGFGAQGSW